LDIYSQTRRLRIKKLSIDEGLSHSLTTSVVEDSKGFVWISTQNGLNRYDGYDFKKYYAGKSKQTLNKNHITSLFKNSFEQLWITYYNGGLDRYSLESELFHSYSPDSLDSNSLSSINTSTNIENDAIIFEDKSFNLWIGTDRGINLYNRESDSFTSFQFDQNNNNSISSNKITSISEDNFGNLWIEAPMMV